MKKVTRHTHSTRFVVDDLFVGNKRNTILATGYLCDTNLCFPLSKINHKERIACNEHTHTHQRNEIK